MAQSVEHVIGNDEVISSILITSSKKAFAIVSAFFVFSDFRTSLRFRKNSDNKKRAHKHGRVFPFKLSAPDLRKQTLPAGGPGGIRTHDLCVANAALSQLSYKPEQHIL